MIKQIQLRGISRTPSDRLSEDGGLSESLNMYMDTAENAPALVPTDVTTDLGLPEGLSAKRIFIHKTANYENYVVVLKDKVVAYTPDIKDDVEPLTVLELTDGEEVTDITSIGNTLIISGTGNMHYVLYKEKSYVYLGTKVPFPHITFNRTDVAIVESLEASVSSDNTGGDFWFLRDQNTFYIPSEEVWNGQKEHKEGKIRSCLDTIWSKVEESRLAATKDGYLTSPVIIRYAVDLYGSTISSPPILVPSSVAESFQAYISATKTLEKEAHNDDEGGVWYNETTYTKETAVVTTEVDKYKIFAHLSPDWNYSDWKDIILSIRLYMSRPLEWGVQKYSSILESRTEENKKTTEGAYQFDKYESSGTVVFKTDEEYLDKILSSTASTFLIKEIPIYNEERSGLTEEFLSLKNGEVLDVQRYVDTITEDYVPMETLDSLKNDDMKHYSYLSHNTSTFNNRLLLVQPSQLIEYDYSNLNAYDLVSHEDTSEAETIFTYDVTYLLRSFKEDKVVKKKFVYRHGATETENIYAFQIFPDSRAYKMIVKVTYGEENDSMPTVKYGEFDMYPHPYLDCAYYYGGIDNKLYTLCSEDSATDYPINAVDDLENKLIVSELNDPFVFPLNSRYTFQSKVVGVAVANTALSQGQFGQFPLYVFTEDGIWAMETAADGSFVSQKPLSREVCINPDSITSIDNAVVFVTSKGVMMVQGAQVMNISPYMNGQHYVPNESAKSLIARQNGFGQYESAISDETPFTSFMKDAKVAYDYSGQRLVFISPDNKDFQYVYKIDTQTWHKVAFEGLDLVAPLNSYPECLIQGKEECIKLTLYVEEISNPGEQSFDMFVDEMTSVTSLTEEELRGMYYDGESCIIYVGDEQRARINNAMHSLWQHAGVSVQYDDDVAHVSRVYYFSTVLDTSTSQPTAKGILITRPFDLGMPDVFKSVTNIKVRGYYDKDNVRFILQGSDNGRDFYTMNSLRGKSWKMFRLFILADLEPTERVSWIDVDFEPRYNNKLR